MASILRPTLAFSRIRPFGRTYVTLNRPGPPPLPTKEQREFEELQRKAQAQPDANHPDSPKPVTPEFEGDVNPVTGERGGPKREPVKQWAEDGGDWSHKGRVSDF